MRTAVLATFLATSSFADCLYPALASAQDAQATDDATKVVRVVRVATRPVIDGRLDESIWQQADVITDFHQIRPGNGTPPSERTEVYLLYDSDALYIGARMFDSEPDRIAAPTARHGQGLGSDDRLVVILDPFNTRRGGYRFETNANGVRHEALYESVDSFQSEWTVIWDTAAAIFENGWTAELEIPFKTLPFDPAIDAWGFNFGRGIRRRGEEMAWVSRNRSYNPSILGLATGLTGMNQGVGLDVVPSLSINQQRAFSPSDTDSDFEPSLDAFYRLTPSLNASLTINTDFSASEVDDRQVNLTRFNLFFPEKRDFFLNDADLFEFGRIGDVQNNASNGSNDNNGRPFFSRRLGLSPSGTPVDLQVGGKVSGRVGRWNIGALAIRQDGFADVDAGSAFVSRISANVLEESTAGLIVTAGDPNSNLDNALVGFDFRYLNTRLPGSRVLEAEAWYQKSDTQGLDGDDSSFGLGLRMPNNSEWRGGLNFKEVQANFNPALGFVSRSDVRDLTGDVGYTYFTDGGFFQSVFFGLDGQRIDLLDGGLQSEVFVARLFEAETNSGEALNVRHIRTREAVSEPFTIYEDVFRQVVLPPDEYSFGETQVSVTTGSQRTFSGGIDFLRGDFYSGTRTNIDVEFAWKQSRHFVLTMEYDWNDIELPEGDFITRLMRLNTEVNFSSTLYWLSLVQYDNVSEVVGVNTRLRWIPTAGQEGLIVLNHQMQDRDKNDAFRSELMDISARASYTLRF
ncbi:MAG: DUF5916 domain-containing protein [Vicinamibacterales bacterium]